MGKRFYLRVTDSDLHKLDIVAQSMGGLSKSAVVRFLIRNWYDQTKSDRLYAQVVNPPTRV